MGFSEDDRIRSKNKLHNEAYQGYINLKNEGLSDEQIRNVCKNFTHEENPRHEIFLTILKIVGRSHEMDDHSIPVASTNSNKGTR